MPETGSSACVCLELILSCVCWCCSSQGPRNLRGLFFPPSSCLWVKWLEVCLSLLFPPFSRALGHHATDNTWKALSTQECPPTQPTARLHADSWQPAQADKLIRPNLSMAGSEHVLPQISLQLPFCSHSPQEPQALLGSWQGPTPARPKKTVGVLPFQARTNAVCPGKSQVSTVQPSVPNPGPYFTF